MRTKIPTWPRTADRNVPRSAGSARSTNPTGTSSIARGILGRPPASARSAASAAAASRRKAQSRAPAIPAANDATAPRYVRPPNVTLYSHWVARPSWTSITRTTLCNIPIRRTTVRPVTIGRRRRGARTPVSANRAPVAMLSATRIAVPTTVDRWSVRVSINADVTALKTPRTASWPIRFTIPMPTATAAPAMSPMLAPAPAASPMFSSMVTPPRTRGRTARDAATADGRNRRIRESGRLPPTMLRVLNACTIPTRHRYTIATAASRPARTARRRSSDRAMVILSPARRCP